MPAPILHVAPFLWSGAGRVITRLCVDQRRTRPVTLVTTGDTDDQADWPAYRRDLARAGVRHHAIDFFHRDAARFWDGVAALTDVIHSVGPAVIHAHAGVPAGAAAISRERAGSRARLVAQMYSWGVGRPSWMDVQDTWGFRQADRVVCSAHAYRRLLRAAGVPASRLTYLPWGLDLDALPFRGVTPPSGDPVIGFVGRLEARKGQLALVEAFARLRQRHPEARLELVGPAAEPAYAATLTAAIARLDLGDAVRVTGRVRDVTAHVRRWHLFVSLSSDEGQGLAVLEAMALGVPVLARPVAGLEDFLLDGRTGWAVRSEAAATVASAMHRALASADTHGVVRRARALVARRYDWRGMLQQFHRVYRA